MLEKVFGATRDGALERSKEAGLLRRRAEAFLRHAKSGLESGDYDFACFAAEQAAQLYPESVLLEVSGEVPRTHRLRDLLAALSRLVLSVECGLSSFVRDNEGISLLEQYYLSSRCLPYQCDREDAQAAVDLAGKLISKVGEVLETWRRGG